MSLPLLDKDLKYISKLDTYPNDVGGMSAEELKAAFDAAGLDIQNYINKLLIPQLESDIEAAAKGISSGGGINGTTLTDNSISSDKIISLDGEKIDNGSLGTEKHKKGSITRELLSEDAKTVHTEDFPNKTVPGRALEDDAVSTAKIENEAVTEKKIAPKAVTEEKIADDAVSKYTSAELAVDGWTAGNGYWHQNLNPALEGTFVRVFADVELSGYESEAERISADEEWGKIYYGSFTEAGAVFFAREKPTTALRVKITAFKK